MRCKESSISCAKCKTMRMSSTARWSHSSKAAAYLNKLAMAAIMCLVHGRNTSRCWKCRKRKRILLSTFSKLASSNWTSSRMTTEEKQGTSWRPFRLTTMLGVQVSETRLCCLTILMQNNSTVKVRAIARWHTPKKAIATTSISERPKESSALFYVISDILILRQ